VKLTETSLLGVLLLDVEPIADERGLFARTWDRVELSARGLNADVAQVSLAYNEVAGTLRGLHLQAAPYAEAKTIRCTAGAVFCVAVDIRDASPTRFSWVGVELTAANRRSIFVPEGCATGYLTLSEGAEVLYQISAGYRPESAIGYRWDDPTLAIEWPDTVRRISERDAALPYVNAGRAPD
jgi:dTDP-4-dehydrorhamnose 3,5-epimerase